MVKWLVQRGRVPGLMISALLAGSSYLLTAGLFARWSATAVLLLVLPMLWNELPTARVTVPLDRWRANWRDTAWQWFPYLLATFGTLVALGPITLGEMPISQDHANHYLSTHILVNDMIPSGRLFGWTDRLGTGYPFGDIYSTSCYLATGLLYLVSFGAVSLPTSYAFGIVIAWLVPALATVAWSRRLGGPWGAVLAGLAFAFDLGGEREGGWVYSMFHGVWPQLFGVGIWLFALLTLWRFAEKATTRRLALSVLLGGFCLWIHPMNSLTLLGAGALMFAVRLFIPARTGAPEQSRGAIRLIPTLFLAGLIGLVWVTRMMLTGDLLHTYPVYWKPIAQLMRELLDGGMFENQLFFVSGLAVIGVLFTLRRAGRFGVFALILPAALLLAGSMDLVTNSDLGFAGGKLGVMQYRRFSIAIKPLWFALAGAGFTAVGLGIKAQLGGVAGQMSNRLVTRVILAVFLAPFVWGLLYAVPGMAKSPSSRPLTMERAGETERLEGLRQLLDKEREHCAGKFCRALFWQKPGHGGLYPLIAIADSGYGYLSTGKMPANNFLWINGTTSVETIARLGVSVVISKWKQEHLLLKKIGKIGRYSVYRVKGDLHEQVEVAGQGSAEIITREPHRRVIRVSSVGAGTELTVLMPPYRKWSASQNGKTLRIEHQRDGSMNFLEILGVQNGDVVLEYQDSTLERIVFLVGALILLFCVVGIFIPSRVLQPPRRLTVKRINTVYRWLAACFGLLVIGTATAVVVGGSIAGQREWLHGTDAGTRVLDIMHRRGADRVDFYPEHFCVRPFTRDPQPGCSEWELMPRVIAAGKREGKIPSCLGVGVPPGGRTEVTFSVPENTTEIRGRLQERSRQSMTGEIVVAERGVSRTVAIGKVSRGGKYFETDISAEASEVTIVLKSDKKALACIELVALGGRGGR